MAATITDLLKTPIVRRGLQNAWNDSQPGEAGGHEEGGFLVKNSSGEIEIVRWPKGKQNQINPPAHPNCSVGEKEIIATFHTHPNTGSDYLQEPGETDKRAVRDDPDLKGDSYQGELVISKDRIYLILTDGEVSNVCDSDDVLSDE